MASLTIPFSDFVSGTTIVSTQVDQNNAAIVDYINARNSAASTWDAVSTIGAFTTTLTSNQIIMGTTRTVTITAPTPGTTSRIWTIPDITSAGTFAALEGTQTFSGAKTFSAAVAITASSGNTLVINTTDFVVDSTNHRVGIGTASPGSGFNLDIQKNVAGNVGGFRISGDDGSSDGGASINMCYNNTVKWSLFTRNVTSHVFSLGFSTSQNDHTQDALELFTNAVKTYQPTSITGTATNDSAAAGFVGQYIESVIPSATNVPGLTTAWGDATSLSLTAGDWDVTSILVPIGNAATFTRYQLGISITSGNSTTGLVQGSNQVDAVLPLSGTRGGFAAIPTYRVSLASTTPVYMKIESDYSAGTPQFTGRISARRVR